MTKNHVHQVTSICYTTAYRKKKPMTINTIDEHLSHHARSIWGVTVEKIPCLSK